MGGLAATAILSICLAGVGTESELNTAKQSNVVSLTEDDLPKLVATRQMLFLIPFTVAAEDIRPNTSVQLWVSENRGKSWEPTASESPKSRGFMFRAKKDGEYWFCVRTLDSSGVIQDDRTKTPELRVLVDTQPPKLDLRAWQGEGGQICSRWAIDETYLKPGSLEILYRTGPKEQWRVLAINRQTDRSRSGSRQVQSDYGPHIVNWCPNTGSKFVQIRAKVVDMAGNTAVSHAHVDLLNAKADLVERPRESSGNNNFVYPNTTLGPIATNPGGVVGSPNRRFTR